MPKKSLNLATLETRIYKWIRVLNKRVLAAKSNKIDVRE